MRSALQSRRMDIPKPRGTSPIALSPSRLSHRPTTSSITTPRRPRAIKQSDHLPNRISTTHSPCRRSSLPHLHFSIAWIYRKDLDDHISHIYRRSKNSRRTEHRRKSRCKHFLDLLLPLSSQRNDSMRYVCRIIRNTHNSISISTSFTEFIIWIGLNQSSFLTKRGWKCLWVGMSGGGEVLVG